MLPSLAPPQGNAARQSLSTPLPAAAQNVTPPGQVAVSLLQILLHFLSFFLQLMRPIGRPALATLSVNAPAPASVNKWKTKTARFNVCLTMVASFAPYYCHQYAIELSVQDNQQDEQVEEMDTSKEVDALFCRICFAHVWLLPLLPIIAARLNFRRPWTTGIPYLQTTTVKRFLALLQSEVIQGCMQHPQVQQ